METKGYIKISRQVLALDIWDDPYDCRLYFFCLLRASHNYYANLMPGQLYYSVQSLAASLNWSRNSVAKHIQILTEAGLIRTERLSMGSVMTILRWEELCGETVLKAADDPLESNAQQMGMAAQPLTWDAQQMGMDAQPLTWDAQQMGMAAQPLTRNAQQMSTSCTPVEHYQNSNQEETKTVSLRAKAFEAWWKLYPRHSRESEARKAWMEMTDVSVETLMLALENAKRSRDWTSHNGRFIPSAVKWLDGNWQDYVNLESEATSEWTEY